MEMTPRALATELTRMMAAKMGQRYFIIKLKMFFENADVENCGVICCGQTSGLIHDVLPVQTIIGQMMHECEATIAKFA